MQVDHDILSVLTPQTLVSAYVHGLFPMVQDGELMWFSPDPRGLLPLDDRFHVSRSLVRTVRRGVFVHTVNHCFDEVVRLCAERSDGEPTWISPEIRLAYGRLHEHGLAHSVEAWPAGSVDDGSPVGGLYGVALGGAFFAESMFHTQTDAGKVAVVTLIERLRERGFTLCDIQWVTDNLARFGAVEMPRDEYLTCLHSAVTSSCQFA